MSQNQTNASQKVQQNQEQVNDNNMTSSIQPTHAEKKDTGIIESRTNYTEPSVEQSKTVEEIQQKQKIQSNQNQPALSADITAQKELDSEAKQIIQDIFKSEPIKKQEASVQVGGGKNIQVLKNTEETYAPQSCQIHTKNQSSTEQSKQKDNLGQSGDNSGSGNKKISQVEIQVGVSLLDEPEKVINQAKQERILSDHEKYSKFLQNQKLMSENQKSVYTHMCESIQSKKSQILSWHDILKDHFSRYASVMKDFAEKCEKIPKQQKSQQANRYLNIGEELKDGFNQLIKFRQNSGNNHRVMYQYTQGKTIKDLEKAYSNYANELSESLSLVHDKKKACLKIEDQFKKQSSKVQKMFNRAKQGKKQEDDFFVEISKVISLQESYRAALIEWGKQMSTLRKSALRFTLNYCTEIQQILNGFKNESNSLYGIQKIKYDKIRNSKDEIAEQTAYNKLLLLVDSDYIRMSLQSSTKKPVTEITDKQFDQFVEMPHAGLLLGEPKQLVMSMIVKKFNLKDKTQELINTVSGNLVLYNKQTLQCTDKLSVKNIKTALSTQQGIIEIEEKVYGVIFASKKKIKIEFQDSDRAEQLVCFLGQGQTNNN